MTTIYAIAAGFGLTLVLGSLLVGGEDADADADGDAEAHDGDLHSHAWMWFPILSLRFWSFACFGFGLVGLGGVWIGLSQTLALPAALLVGWALGAGASWLFRQLHVETVSGDTTLGRFVGEQGTVLVPLRPGGVGLVRLRAASGDVDVPAASQDGHELGVGSRVLVAGFDGRTAQVTGLPASAG